MTQSLNCVGNHAIRSSGQQKPIGCFMEENNSTFLLNWLDEWTFRKRENIYEFHQFHKYPATFIPELVDKIINLYSKKGDTVLDIFSGSGTALLEAMLLERKSIGIELNPLACLISIVKTTPIEGLDFNKEKISLINSIKNYEHNVVNFENIDFWFHKEAIIELSNILGSINSIKCDNFKNLALVSLSDIIRYVSLCKHSGFKMHKDQKKLEKKFKKYEIMDLFIDKLENNINHVVHINNKIKNISVRRPFIINSDSRIISEHIGKESVDLIITSPPYGDSRTTVAYGEFSRLSSQFLGLESISKKSISRLDNDLLGGKLPSKEIEIEISHYSPSLGNIIELFKLRFEKSNDVKIKKRLNDIISFYYDLFLCMKNSYHYLKNGKYMCMVTASRVVHNTKLHTDIIISEMGNYLGFKLKNIHYRDIPNKRMPSRVSAKNITGVVSPTMTMESIIVMKKI